MWVFTITSIRYSGARRKLSPLTTHRKTSKKLKSNQLQSTAPDETILSDVEPLPYGASRVMKEVYDEAGLLGFWKGVFPTLIMVSNPAIQFMLYETMLKKLQKRRSLHTQSNNGATAFQIFLLGALAKLGATSVTYPLNVVKARLQRFEHFISKRHRYKGARRKLSPLTVREEGLEMDQLGCYLRLSWLLYQGV